MSRFFSQEVKFLDCVLFMAGGEMGIAHGHLQGFVAHQVLKGGNVNALHGKVGGKSVAKVMEAEVCNACFL